jgi:hypothetical protein
MPDDTRSAPTMGSTRSISIIGPPGAGKTTLCRRLGLEIDDDKAWQNAVGVAARDGWAVERLFGRLAELSLPGAALVCVTPIEIVRRQNRERHARRPGKPDWAPHAERAGMTTMLAAWWLWRAGVPVLFVDTERPEDEAIRNFVRA